MLERLIHPPMRPEEFREPRWARFLFAGTVAAWLWLVVRVYVASVFLPAGWGEDHERKVAVRRRLADPGPRHRGDPEHRHAGLVRLVPPERRPAERRPVRDPRRARGDRGRARAARRAPDGHRRVRWRLPELELRPRRRARLEPGARWSSATLLALAWRNAGWIGLDRWFMPWIHGELFAKPSAAEPEPPAAATLT